MRNDYEERFYRSYCKDTNFHLEVEYKETDLYISCDRYIEKELVRKIVKEYYWQIEEYIKKKPLFLHSLSPLQFDEEAPLIVQDMLRASSLAGVGPFSSVAGAISYYVGKRLLKFCDELIIENGGDIFLKINEDKRIGLYLGGEVWCNTVVLKVKRREYPFGICSSSSVIGHSLNFGKAELVTVISKSPIVADSFATGFSNRIRKENDVKTVIREAKKIPLIEGIVVAFGGKIAIWGDVEICS